MKKPVIKLPDSAIDENDIWKGSLSGRSMCARNIREMLADETEPVVVAVNGKWGCGKTYFLERFAKEYEHGGKGGVCIYLNAWENDYLSNPLLFVLSGMHDAIKDQSKYRYFTKNTLDALKAIIPELAWNGLTAAVPFNLLGGTREALEKRPVSDYAQQTKLNKELKKTLVAISAESQKGSGKPLIVCVDELDRCRPTYAIEMLERIKHFFNIPGIVFMLGIDRSQLCTSIASVYGDIDTDNYLHRFFDLEFVLPDPDRGAFIDSKFKEYGLESHWDELDRGRNMAFCAGEGNAGKKVIRFLASVHKLELREIQTALKWLVVLFRGQQPGCRAYSDIGAILVVLKLRNRKLLEQFLKGLATPADVLDFLLPQEPDTDFWRDDFPAAKRIVAAVYCSFTISRNLNDYYDILARACSNQPLTNEQIGTLPWFFKTQEKEAMQQCLKKTQNMSTVYDRDTLRMVAARLETLGWQTER